MSKDHGTIEIPEPGSYKERINRAKGDKAPVGGVPQLAGTPQFDNLPLPPAERQRRESLQAAMGVSSSVTPVVARKTLTPGEQKELQERGRFVPGIGSAIRANQPAAASLAADADAEAPTRAERGDGPLSDETLRGIEAMAHDIEEKAKTEVTEKELLEEFRNNPLASRKRRKEIEARLVPLELDMLLTHGEIRQVVPIYPEKFSVTFASTNGDVDLFVKRMSAYEEPPAGKEDTLVILNEENHTRRFLMDRFLMLNLTASVYAINGRALLKMLDDNGNPQPELFWKKFKQLKRYPMPLLQDISINSAWFTERLLRITLSDDLLKELQNF